MIFRSNRVRIMVATKPVDFRKGHDGLAAPGIKDGLMTLTHAQFEDLFAGLDWRRVHAVKARTPQTVE